MKAVRWYGKEDIRVENVPEPKILNDRDAIIRVTSTAICGSDLHMYDGYVPTMQAGDILGHEFMGEVVEVGKGVRNLSPGDRIIVPFPIACGSCFFCRHELYSLCDNSNPNAWMLEGMYGYSGAGLFGYSHLYGGFDEGQAQFARVPFADVGHLKIPDHLKDEQVLFLTDIFPTGFMAADYCNIHGGDVVAVWGCGPVGLFAIKSAYMLGAERVIAIDCVPERLRLAQSFGGAEIIDDSKVDDIVEEIKLRTGGRGPDSCIDAVGMEAHGHGITHLYDEAKQMVRLESDRPTALRQVLQACRKGGTVSIPGVYTGFIDKVPIGAAFAKGLTIKMGQCHVHKYMKPLLDRIMRGEIDPSAIITHHLPLEEAPRGYRMFRNKENGCVKIVMHA